MESQYQLMNLREKRIFVFICNTYWLTGKIIDINIKSKYCKSCEYWKGKEDTKEWNPIKSGLILMKIHVV